MRVTIWSQYRCYLLVVLMSNAITMPAMALSLEEALKSSYETNPAIQRERKSLAAIDEQMAQAISEWRPSVSVDYVKGHQTISYGGAAETYADKETRQLSVNQPLFNGGGSIARYDVAEANIEAGRAQLEAVTQQVLLQTITAYIAVIRDEEISQLSIDNVRVLEAQKSAVDERFKLEEVTNTDVAQANARLARAKSDRILADGARTSSIAFFQRITGVQPTDLVLPTETPELPVTLEAALVQADAINPNLRRALQLAEARENEVDAQKSGILPTISLQGTMRREEGVGGMFGSTDYDNDSLTVNFTIPLYQSGAEYSRIRQARQNRESARFEALDMQGNIKERVSQAWEAVNNNRAAIEAFTVAVASAEDALKGVKMELDFGTRSVLDVLDAEQELFASRLGLIRAKHDQVTSAYTLVAEIGQLTPERLALNVDTYNPEENLERIKFRSIGY